MRSIIVDAGPLIALFSARDEHHEAAKAVLQSNPAVLVSTWPVLTEAYRTRTGKRLKLLLA